MTFVMKLMISIGLCSLVLAFLSMLAYNNIVFKNDKVDDFFDEFFDKSVWFFLFLFVMSAIGLLLCFVWGW